MKTPLPAIRSSIATFCGALILGIACPTASAQDSGDGSVHGEPLSFDELESHLETLPPPIMDSAIYNFLLFDLLEYRAIDSEPDTLNWDFVSWFGGDYNRLWIKSEGELDLEGPTQGVGDVQFLYGRMIAPFWDFQAGVRFNQNLGSGFDGSSRTYGVIGLQGLAPYRFEFEPAIYISDRGEVSAQLTASYDLLLTERLILQPRFEGSLSLQGDPRFQTGDGLNDIELGLRLRYEISREFAPYIGVSWGRLYGDTADIARTGGDSVENVAPVAGVRLWW